MLGMQVGSAVCTDDVLHQCNFASVTPVKVFYKECTIVLSSVLFILPEMYFFKFNSEDIDSAEGDRRLPVYRHGQFKSRRFFTTVDISRERNVSDFNSGSIFETAFIHYVRESLPVRLLCWIFLN